LACSRQEQILSLCGVRSWTRTGSRFGQMGSRGSGGGRRIRSAATGSAGVPLTLCIHSWLLSRRVQARPGPQDACEVLRGMMAFSAMPSSVVGYIGPCWDMPGQLAFMGENRTGVTSVPGGGMRNPGRRLSLPAGLTQPEREFFLELRRLTDVAGFTYRALEELTSSFKPATGNPCFYGKSQWGRWLNGQSMPPRNAVSRLAEILATEGIAAGRLLDLWSRTFMPRPRQKQNRTALRPPNGGRQLLTLTCSRANCPR
jgi:helix-turn-helix protein